MAHEPKEQTLEKVLFEQICERFEVGKAHSFASPDPYGRIAEFLGIELIDGGSGWSVASDGAIRASKTRFRRVLGQLAGKRKIAIWRNPPEGLGHTERPTFVRLNEISIA